LRRWPIGGGELRRLFVVYTRPDRDLDASSPAYQDSYAWDSHGYLFARALSYAYPYQCAHVYAQPVADSYWHSSHAYAHSGIRFEPGR